jgi:hypothetical protein
VTSVISDQVDGKNATSQGQDLHLETNYEEMRGSKKY